MARERIRTTIPEIVDYWAKHTGECGLSVDFAEAHERCWRCGCQRSLERYHIVPASLGGEDTPSNFVILCKRCHLDNPNVADPEVMWDWLRAYGVPFYDTFWWVNGIEEYKKIYGRSYAEELRTRGISPEDPAFKAVLDEQRQKASYHFEGSMWFTDLEESSTLEKRRGNQIGSIRWETTLFPNTSQNEVTTNRTTEFLGAPFQGCFLFHKNRMD